MSRKGGYIILNLQNYPLTAASPTTVPGANVTISNGKVVLISGMKVGEVIYPDFFANFENGIADMTAFTITITETDSVTVDVKS